MLVTKSSSLLFLTPNYTAVAHMQTDQSEIVHQAAAVAVDVVRRASPVTGQFFLLSLYLSVSLCLCL